jgi:hypothetical protein
VVARVTFAVRQRGGEGSRSHVRFLETRTKTANCSFSSSEWEARGEISRRAAALPRPDDAAAVRFQGRACLERSFITLDGVQLLVACLAQLEGVTGSLGRTSPVRRVGCDWSMRRGGSRLPRGACASESGGALELRVGRGSAEPATTREQCSTARRRSQPETPLFGKATPTPSAEPTPIASASQTTRCGGWGWSVGRLCSLMREALTRSAAAENDPFARIVVFGLLVEFSDAPGDLSSAARRPESRNRPPLRPARDGSTTWPHRGGGHEGV